MPDADPDGISAADFKPDKFPQRDQPESPDQLPNGSSRPNHCQHGTQQTPLTPKAPSESQNSLNSDQNQTP